MFEWGYWMLVCACKCVFYLFYLFVVEFVRPTWLVNLFVKLTVEMCDWVFDLAASFSTVLKCVSIATANSLTTPSMLMLQCCLWGSRCHWEWLMAIAKTTVGQPLENSPSGALKVYQVPRSTLEHLCSKLNEREGAKIWRTGSPLCTEEGTICWRVVVTTTSTEVWALMS